MVRVLLKIGFATAIAVIAAAPARAADTVVATVAKATTIDAYGGRAVWSTWDPAASAYRLTVYRGGRVRMLPVAPNAEPFEVDLGPGPHGGTIAVYSRCRHPVRIAVPREGRRGCDLYAYRFSTAREAKLTRANSKADEHWPAVWGNRIAFARTYKPDPQFSPHVLYWRPLTGKGGSHRLHGAPAEPGDGYDPQQLDLRGPRVTFVAQYEWGANLVLTTTGGHRRLLVRMPGSGAEVNDLTAQGPTISGAGAVDWAFSVGQDEPVFTELRRVDLKTGDETRATTRVDADPARDRATAGFAHDGATSWYVRAAAAGAFEIHMATALAYEPAPPPSASFEP